MDEVAADIDVIILHEDKLVGKLPMMHQLGNLLEHTFARFIARMRLAGEDELDRTLRIIHHRCKPFQVGQDQIRSLISGEAPGKADRQRIRRQDAAHRFRRLSSVSGLLDCAYTHKVQ